MIVFIQRYSLLRPGRGSPCIMSLVGNQEEASRGMMSPSLPNYFSASWWQVAHWQTDSQIKHRPPLSVESTLAQPRSIETGALGVSMAMLCAGTHQF